MGSREVWKYDGSADTAFPGLFRGAKQGYKGLTMSNFIAMRQAMADRAAGAPYRWACIAEDDVILDERALRAVREAVLSASPDTGVIWCDKRGRGGACLICYRIDCLSRVMARVHPLSNFSQTYEERMGRCTLWDWVLWDALAASPAIPTTVLKVVDSGLSESTISNAACPSHHDNPSAYSNRMLVWNRCAAP